MLSQRHKNASGFTLIEAMVTLTVFAILIAVGVPSMRTWIMNNKVRSVSDALQNGLRLAQTESLRRSRQVVFALTNSNAPTIIPVAAAADATSWAIYSVPSMAGEQPEFIQSGVLSNASLGVQVISNGTAALCFNSVGRLTNNTDPTLTQITGGATCAQPNAGVPPVQKFNISAITGGDRPLQVNLGLGGQVHMCDPNVGISDVHPEGCP